MKTPLIILLATGLSLNIGARKNETTFSQHEVAQQNTGTELVLTVEHGKEHNHPVYAVWLADEDGSFIQTLYVSETIGKGVFKRAKRHQGQWQSGAIQRPASLPFWAHQRNIRNEYGHYIPSPSMPELDAYTGATPKASFRMRLRSDRPLQGNYIVYLELNQSWDWNQFWHNDKYGTEPEYKTSSQPAVVYKAQIHIPQTDEIELHPIGHSHPSGKDGSLNPDLSTLTTALHIVKRITISTQQKE